MALLLGAQPGRALSYGAAVLAAHLGGGGRKAGRRSGRALVSAAKNRRAAGQRWLSQA